MDRAIPLQRRLGSGRIRVCDDLKLGRLAGRHVAGEIAGEGEEAGKLVGLHGSKRVFVWQGLETRLWGRGQGAYDLMAYPSVFFEGDDCKLDPVIARANAGETEREPYHEDDREEEGKPQGEAVADEYPDVLDRDQQTLAQYRRHGR